jgi:AcrR family transcriptional regulator
VLDAALVCVGEKGPDGIVIEEICRRAGASVGSVYHQFGSKAGIAAALYLDLLADYQQAVGKAVQADSGAREGVLALVGAHLDWVAAHPARARFLQEMRRSDALAAHETEIRELNRAFGGAIGGWARTHMEGGRLRRLPVDLFMAQLLGPANEYARGLLGGRDASAPELAAAQLGEAAWRALGSD